MEHPSQQKSCPHCGAALPEEASFCPYCAQTVLRRTRLSPPGRTWRKGVRRAVTALLLAAVLIGAGAGWYLHTRPQVYDAQGEVLYTGEDGVTYQVVLASSEDRFQPAYTAQQSAEVGEQYRFPVRLYINNVDSDASANETFLKRVSQVSAEFLPPKGDGTVSCLEPAPAPDYSPDAALVSYVDFTAQDDFLAQMVWTLWMDNGDLIRLRQDLSVSTIRTYDYYPEDAPMTTSEELQALVDQISATVEPEAAVNIHLPAVTYTGNLELHSHPIRFHGSTEGDRRTTFTGSTRLDYSASHQGISFFEDIDFRGSGDGIGLSTAANARTVNCSFTGWKTAVLGYGSAWVNVIGCTFEDNITGFHFNSTGSSANHSMYTDNLFRNNTTAVLLENVPTELALNFRGTVFAGNGTDIDNRCSHAVDISQAIFS